MKVDLSSELALCMLKDRFFLKRKYQQCSQIADPNKMTVAVEAWQKKVEESKALLSKRKALTLNISYPDLPVSDKKDAIKALISKNQVLIVAGETGSGKTTQIPKMCLELGRGRAAMIAHTQPRRLAARNVAGRIAEELDSELGALVGYKVRFTDQVSDNSLVKLLTDGMLLAEMQQDKFLNQYDTIIIDEAHERSLNIDFLLGYIKRVLPKRPDLKVIITSATIETDKFASHFNNAPVIEVSGRSYPVEIRHKDYIAEDLAQDQSEAILLAVDELFAEGRGDILIFLSGEREIRETQQALIKKQYKATEILPLYARMGAKDQQLIFHPKGSRRIVLATNVAETSLTVPGIKYVIDTGKVRMSRYSHRLKVQRLPIETVSQASAKQRAGRCGRTSAGICIRLYSEQDFLSRPAFTDPEITRTHLSSVILQMLALGLGEISHFEFIQAPEDKFISDGQRLLVELEAITKHRGMSKLTPIGRKMAKLPLDPKYARMLIAAKDHESVYEIMVITAGLSVQDPRERPHDKQQKADEAHALYADKNSDLLSLLNLYEAFKTEQKNLTQNQLRKYCTKHYINFQRMREWQDIVHQVKHTLVSVDLRLNKNVAEYEQIHLPVIAGLSSQIGLKDANRQYQGARNSQFKLFPGSGLFAKPPKWIVSAELVETSNLYARQAAKIEPEWIEKVAKNLFKYNYVEAHWSMKRGAVLAYMNATLFGLPIVQRRTVNYANINPVEARDIFIRHALVNGESKLNFAFLRENQALVSQVELLEKKSRRRDILIDEDELVDFYSEKLPENVNSEASFKKWWQRAVQISPNLLKFEQAQLVKRDASGVSKASFPDTWQQDSLVFSLSYQFEPGKTDDGVCVNIPIGLLNQVKNIGFDWLVPGLRQELLVALIKSLPKRLRRNFVPAPDYANACMQDLTAVDKNGIVQNITDAFANKLFRMSGVKVSSQDFDIETIESHLRFNFAVVSDKGKVLGSSKSLPKLKQQFESQLKQTLEQVATEGIEKASLSTFSMETIPKRYRKTQNGFEIEAFPGLKVVGNQVDLALFTLESEAKKQHAVGTILLLKQNVPSPLKYLQEKLPNKSKLSLYFNPFGKVQLLIDDIASAAIAALVNEHMDGNEIREQRFFKTTQEFVRMHLNDKALKIAKQVETGLALANQIQKFCKGNIPLNHVSHISHIKSHLNELVFKGFVLQTGESGLGDWNRYLKGLLVRCEKLKIDLNRDRVNQIEIDKAQSLLIKCKEEYATQMKDLEEVNEIQEMIQEFRISLFAQNLGTKYPISLKRISNKLNEISNKG
ncbi:ATP-dependent RNA helicase HrpA [Glaciecola petra]|uniref:ATP-dependent RNA helicase HrpA n=1 Tax=Glaciecola petra TaxID=3075602 RepID=A0ABU2ZNJ2_9ALTE|nr:ATP-dependent RNA helicase HrpA [Aestuariibacter sp. P117]MDT0594197.1 ATP-dependent RNA helicase HrpA [Aestuariibacter sp. P117]